MPQGPQGTITRALISVSDKTNLVPFAQFLADRNIEILSTGGTARTLSEAGIAVTEVAAYTGFPEMLDGRVKTLHPHIHGGILGQRGNAEHRAAMAEHGIGTIDLVIVNLYPFEETVAGGGDFETCIENIDIGGPALIRAAAKNHGDVTVVTSPHQYNDVMAEMTANNGATSLDARRKLAATAFAHTGAYDGMIATWFAATLGDTLPERVVVPGTRKQVLRYGENPHQQAALYVGGDKRRGVATATQIQGKELSFNNLNDTDAAFELVAEFDAPTIAIIKHANPSGVASATSLLDAYSQALACDSTSAFGGIVAANRPIDGAIARAIIEVFTEVVIAPEVNDEAAAVFAAKKNLRVLTTNGMPGPATGLTVRSIAGGFLAQTRDTGRIGLDDLKVVTERAPTEQELDDLLFAFRVCKHVKSNAIVYVKSGATVGIGAGQMSRIDSARIAAWKAEEGARALGETQSRARGSVVASDAFFPFADGLIAAAEAGVTAVIQPGGSMRDNEVIDAANTRGLAMVMTSMRHFRH